MFGPITNADTTSCLLRTTGETSRRSPRDRYPVHIRENWKGKINVAVTENAAFTMILRDTVLHCVNYQPLKHVGLQLGVGMGDVLASLEPATIGQLTSGGNPYQSRRKMAWPSPFGQRHMLYSPRCHHRIPQATLGLTHASQGGLRKQVLKQHKGVSQCLPPLKRWAYLRLIVNPVYRYFK